YMRGGLAWMEGRHVDALAHYKVALARREKLYGPDHPEVVQVLNNLANAYTINGRFSDALATFERAATTVARLYGPDHPAAADAYAFRGNAYFSLGRYP